MSAVAVDTLRETMLRSWRRTLRRPVPLSFSFVQPLLWMLIFGFLFHRFELGPDYAGRTYSEFVLPGICCMTVLFGASQSGIALVRDLQTGFVQRLVRAATHPGWMLAGMIAADALRLIAQAVVVAVLGIGLGARPDVSAGGMAIAIAGLILFAFAYASLSCLIALRTRAQESMAVFVHVMNMPLLFTSTALVPTRQMPGWLATIAQYNPLSLVASALRDAMLHGRPGDATILLTLGAAAAIMFTFARMALRRGARG